jgi:hypothetical protein
MRVASASLPSRMVKTSSLSPKISKGVGSGEMSARRLR